MELQAIKNRFGIIGNAPGLNHSLHVAVQVANTDLSVLINGESGVGKEVFSQIIHALSARKHNPFIAVNCGAIPEGTIDSELFGHEKGSFTGALDSRKGYFETVNGGTIFLDEIGEMPLGTQARLLRVLEAGEYIRVGSSKVQKTDVRVIAASNKDLLDYTHNGRFREDLYYRLNGLVVKLPPIRERTDLEAVINKVLALESISVTYTLAPDIMQVFKLHNWPGNFRQLTNLLRTAIVMADDCHEIRKEHLPDDFFEDVEFTKNCASITSTSQFVASGTNLEEMEILVIQKSLESHHGNVSATARALGVSRNTIYRKTSLPK